MTNILDMDGLPVPGPDRDTRPFWEGASDRRLLVQHCPNCGRWIWQPRPLCPGCHHDAPTWERITGAGTVASWIVPHAPVLPALASLTPFVVLLVELAEGIRMVGNLVHPDGELVRATSNGFDELGIGSHVALRWREQRGWTLPCWTLRTGIEIPRESG